MLLSYFGCWWCKERRYLGVFPPGSSCPRCFPQRLPSGPHTHTKSGQRAMFQVRWPCHMTDWARVKRWWRPPFTAIIYYFSWTCSQSSCGWKLWARDRRRHAEAFWAHTRVYLHLPVARLWVPSLSPWGPCPVSHCPGELCGSDRMSTWTVGSEVKNLA